MVLADGRNRTGQFILTGSQNFHLQEAISQSLSGRRSLMKLLPLSHRELAGLPPRDIFGIDSWDIPDVSGKSPFEQVFKGSYPPIYDRKIKPTNWLSQYTQSYLERDIRTLVNVSDLETFERFFRLAAAVQGRFSIWIRSQAIPAYPPRRRNAGFLCSWPATSSSCSVRIRRTSTSA